jgi:cobalamin biosynthesis Mg chelatase CobN
MAVRHLRPASEAPTESQLLRAQLARVEAAFYDDKTRPTDLLALSVEMRELRGLIKAAEAAENKTLSVVADTADEPLS